MFLPKLPMPVLTGFTTTNRYTFAVGFTTVVNTPLLKPHTTRFTGSSGSGTDSGRTTFSAPSFETGAGCSAGRATVQHASAISRIGRLCPQGNGAPGRHSFPPSKCVIMNQSDP